MLQIIMLVVGLIGLVVGKIKVTQKRVVKGTRARLVALVLLAQIPLSLGIHFLANGGQPSPNAWVIDLGTVLGCFAVAMFLAVMLAEPVEEPAPAAQKA